MSDEKLVIGLEIAPLKVTDATFKELEEKIKALDKMFKDIIPKDLKFDNWISGLGEVANTLKQANSGFDTLGEKVKKTASTIKTEMSSLSSALQLKIDAKLDDSNTKKTLKESRDTLLRAVEELQKEVAGKAIQLEVKTSSTKLAGGKTGFEGMPEAQSRFVETAVKNLGSYDAVLEKYKDKTAQIDKYARAFANSFYNDVPIPTVGARKKKTDIISQLDITKELEDLTKELKAKGTNLEAAYKRLHELTNNSSNSTWNDIVAKAKQDVKTTVPGAPVAQPVKAGTETALTAAAEAQLQLSNLERRMLSIFNTLQELHKGALQGIGNLTNKSANDIDSLANKVQSLLGNASGLKERLGVLSPSDYSNLRNTVRADRNNDWSKLPEEDRNSLAKARAFILQQREKYAETYALLNANKPQRDTVGIPNAAAIKQTAEMQLNQLNTVSAAINSVSFEGIEGKLNKLMGVVADAVKQFGGLATAVASLEKFAESASLQKLATAGANAAVNKEKVEKEKDKYPQAIVRANANAQIVDDTRAVHMSAVNAGTVDAHVKAKYDAENKAIIANAEAQAALKEQLQKKADARAEQMAQEADERSRQRAITKRLRENYLAELAKKEEAISKGRESAMAFGPDRFDQGVLIARQKTADAQKAEVETARQAAIEQTRDLELWKTKAALLKEYVQLLTSLERATKKDASYDNLRAGTQDALTRLRNTDFRRENGPSIQEFQEHIARITASKMAMDTQRVAVGTATKSSLITDVGTAQAAAYAEQVKRVVDELYRLNVASKGVGLSLEQVNSIISKSGLASHLDVLGRSNFDALNSGLKKVGFNFKDASGEIEKSKRQVEAFHSSLAQMATRLAEFYTIRDVFGFISGETRQAIHGIIEYRQTVAEISAITVATKEQTKAYEETISELARSSKFSAQEIAASMKVVAQSGVSRENLIPVTRASEVLAAGVGGSTSDASNLLTTIMNVWGVQAHEAMGVTNQLTTVMKSSKTSITDLATSFNYIASQGKLANMSITEVSAAVGILRNQGIMASTAGTGLSQFMRVLTAPTPKVKKFFAEIGITQEEVDKINPKLTSLGDILNFIREKGIKKFGTEMDLTDKILQAFETRTGRAAAALINQGDAFNALTLAQANSDAGFLALHRTMEGVQTRINKLKHEFQLLVQSIGEDLSKAIASGYGGLFKLTTALQDGAVRADIFKIALVGIATVGIASLVTNFASFITFLKSPAVTLTLMATAALVERIYRAKAPIMGDTSSAIDTYQREASEDQNSTLLVTRFQNRAKRKGGAPLKFSELDSTAQQYLEALKEQDPETHRILTSEADASAGSIAALKALALKKGRRILPMFERANALADERERLQQELGLINSNLAAGKFNKNADKVGLGTGLDALDRIETINARLKGIDKEQADLSLLTDSKQISKSKAGRYNMWEAHILAEGGNLGPKETDPNYQGQINITPDLKPDKAAIAQEKKERALYTLLNKTSNEIARKSADENRKLNELILRDADKTEKERNDALIRIKEDNNKIIEAELKEKIRELNDALGKDFNVKLSDDGSTFDVSKLSAKQLDNFRTAKKKIQDLIDDKLVPYYRTDELGRRDAAASKEGADVTKRLQDTFDKDFKRILDDSYKAQVDLKRKVAEDAFKSDLVDWEEKTRLYNDAKLAITEKYARQYDEKALEEIYKFKKLPQTDENKKKLADILKELGIASDASRDKDLEGLSNNYVNAPIKLDVRRREREIERAERATIDAANLRKDRGWTGAEATQSDIDVVTAQKRAQEEKITLYSEEFRLSKQKFDAEVEEAKTSLANKVKGSDEEKAAQRTLEEAENKRKQRLDEINEKLQDSRELVRQQGLKLDELKDSSFWGNFEDGVKSVTRSITDFKKAAHDAGSALMNTSFNGLSGAFQGSFSTIFAGTDLDPNAAALRQLRLDIGAKEQEKKQLEMDIRTIEANTSKTPAEIKTLNEKKLALQGVNTALDAQKKSLKEQTNAWSAFAAGMKKFAQQIVQEIQNIIARMIAMKIIGSIVGIFAGGGGDAIPAAMEVAGTNAGGAPVFADGRSVFATGGLVPLSAGKPGVDSVPAMLMPGEIIIKKSSVDYYGADRLLALNEGKIQKFANGGLVGSSRGAGSIESASQTLQIVNIVQGQQVPDPGQNAQQVINVINQDIVNRGPTYKTIKSAVSS